MNNPLYTGIIIPAGKAADGETATAIYVTEENNGRAIWRQSAEEGLICLRLEPYTRADTLIEEAVQMVLRERKAASHA